MSTSTGTLTKTLGQDYKKMMGNGSIDSMDKSVLSSEASFEAYENHAEHPQNEYQKLSQRYNEYVNHSALRSTSAMSETPHKVATIGAASKSRGKTAAAAVAALAYEHNHPDSFELSYRNEGFRDNSTFSGTRQNSTSTSIAEDMPIIHQTDVEDTASDYYGNASTLPLRTGATESLSFLSELKQTLPEYKEPQTHSSFLPTGSRPMSKTESHSSTLPYEQKIDKLNFTPVSEPMVDEASLIRNGHLSHLTDMRRPDSYYTAVRSSKAQPQTAKPMHTYQPSSIMSSAPHEAPPKRPKTVYQTANEEPPRSSYHRSKSEALLETDFDDDSPSMVPLQTNGRSYSQPLETAM